ncbi:MAG: extracellular solute-binding protein [Phycisphaerales bacterium]
MPSGPLEITRRAALATLGAGALGYALLGPRARSERPDGRLVLDYWEKWTQNEAAAMRRVVDRFNQSQNRLWVRYFSMGTIDQKSMIAIAGGSPPDILGLGNFSIPAYAESGAILPLDDLAARHSIRREAYAPKVWEMLTHVTPTSAQRARSVSDGSSNQEEVGAVSDPLADARGSLHQLAPARGSLYGIINTCGALAMFYNRALFREAGLDPDNPPRTIQQLDAAHRALTRFEKNGTLTQTDDGTSEIARAGFLHMEPTWWTWFWGAYFGDSIHDAARNLATPDSPANLRAYQWVQTYPAALKPDRLTKFQTGFGFYGTSEHPFLKGKVAMTNQGPWLANVIHQYAPELDYAVAPFPVDESIYDPAAPIGLLDGDVLVIPRGVRDPEASFEFIAFTQRPENIELLSAAHGKNSPLVSQSEDFEKSHVNRFVSVHSKVANSPRAFTFPRTRTWQEYQAEFDAAMQRMWRLEAPAPEALAKVRIAAQKQLDRAAAARARRAAL